MNKKSLHSVIDQAELTIARHELFVNQERTGILPVVIMVSGGSDSVALLHILCRLYPQELDRFVVLHINHLLRGEASDEDEAFVCTLAAELGVRYESERIDVAALAQTNKQEPPSLSSSAHAASNIEQLGRKERYKAANALLDRLCDEIACARAAGRIVTAHTLDDRAETFLMRSTVGAGTSGLRSIPFKNDRVIRPLLDCKRADLRAWLASEQTRWREDATNADTTRFRSFIRHEVLLRMRERNPAVLDALQHTMDILAAEDEYLNEQALALAARTIEVPAGDESAALILSAEALNESLPLARRVVHTACNYVVSPEERITFEHVEAIVRAGSTPGFAITLPGNIDVRNEYGKLRFSRNTESTKSTKDGKTIEEGSFELTTFSRESIQGDPIAYVTSCATPTMIFVDADTLPFGEPYLSKPQAGDRFCPLGMGGQHRLVSDVLIDRKIPARLRSTIPVLRVASSLDMPQEDGKIGSQNDKIIWIVGILQDNRYIVTEKTTTIGKITFKGKDAKGLLE